LTQRVERYERELIMKALERSGHVQTQAAKTLGINRTALIYKLKKYELLDKE
jgi:transcriptional regulator with PAS, ATPase and Fis domain